MYRCTDLPIYLFSYPQHLIAAALEFVGHRLDLGLVAKFGQPVLQGRNVGRALASQIEQWENTDFLGDATEFTQRGAMEIK